MRPLGRLDKALLVFVLPVWLVCFALHVKQARTTGLPVIPMYVSASEDPNGHPRVVRFWPSSLFDTRTTGLEVGDELTHVGELALEGVGPVGFVARVHQVYQPGEPVSIAYRRGDETGAGELHLEARPDLWWWYLPLAVSWAATGVLLLLRVPVARVGRVFFGASASFSLVYLRFYGGPVEQTYAWIGVYALSTAIAFPLLLQAALWFPPELVGRDPRISTWPWVFALTSPLVLSFSFGVPLPRAVASPLQFLVAGAFVVAGVGAVTRNYRRARPIGRRQVKWVLYGVYLTSLPVGAAVVTALLRPEHWILLEVATISGVIVPVCIWISIARYNLFDIDRLMSATASYSALSVVFLAFAFTVIPRVAEAASDALRLDPVVGQVGFALILATAAIPAHRRLRPRIDRVFFRERYALEQGLQQLLEELSSCEDPRELFNRAGESLDRLLRPENAAIYGRAGDAFVPVFVRGRGIPPAFESQGPLIAALAARTRPLTAEGWSRRRGAELSPFDRAALETLGAEVVLPIRMEARLAAFICLGAKRSGDVHTPTDVALLAAVAGRLSSELRRFDEADVSRNKREMYERIRRYVPGAVATELESGDPLEAREVEVSVLFVDIRGYTRYSESREPHEVFSLLNRYTEAVSEIVRKYGGTIVEFNGDGMMAVFGAPQALANREHASVRAGTELAIAVPRLLAQQAPAVTEALAIGIGIASGPAFVGSIRSVDRLIWSAVGTTTNRAARLQALTEELDAVIVLDAVTRQAAGPPAAPFALHEETWIRGLSTPEDVYSWSPVGDA